MTWWETQEMAEYISGIELRLDEWSMSNPQMRIEENNLNRLEQKIEKILSQTNQDEKKAILEHLANRIEGLRQLLIERLRRDIPG